MLVGIISDSHGDADATAKAVALLKRRGAEKLFHCGDICGTGVLDELAGHDCTFVWGNCDDPSPLIRQYAAMIGLSTPPSPVHVEVAGKRIGLYHGHERRFRFAHHEQKLDYLFYGHTHQHADHRENGCRMINPGALHRAAIKTVATLDLDTGELTFLSVDTGEEVTL